MVINFRKVILAGLGINIASILIPLISYKAFSWVFELEPIAIWKWTPNTPISELSPGYIALLLLINTTLAIYFVYLYAIFYKSIPGTGIRKGLVFGLFIFPIGVLIPIFSLFVVTNIAAGALIYFAIEGLIEFILYGIIVGLIYNE